MTEKRIAYEGTFYTVEWFFDEKGISQPLEYYDKQPGVKKRKLVQLFKVMCEHGKIFDETKFRNEGDKIYAFKPQPDRYLCFFFQDKRIIVTNAFLKKSPKLPNGEKEQALKALKSYQKRLKDGSYYEEES